MPLIKQISWNTSMGHNHRERKKYDNISRLYHTNNCVFKNENRYISTRTHITMFLWIKSACQKLWTCIPNSGFTFISENSANIWKKKLRRCIWDIRDCIVLNDYLLFFLFIYFWIKQAILEEKKYVTSINFFKNKQ